MFKEDVLNLSYICTESLNSSSSPATLLNTAVKSPVKHWCQLGGVSYSLNPPPLFLNGFEILKWAESDRWTAGTVHNVA